MDAFRVKTADGYLPGAYSTEGKAQAAAVKGGTVVPVRFVKDAVGMFGAWVPR